jgi:altronate dehydratase
LNENPRAVATESRLLQLSDKDNVCVALVAVEAGQCLTLHGQTVEIRARIPMGHKIAVRPIAEGETVVKYGASIGVATRPIAAGEHVHTHNLRSNYFPTFTHDRSGGGSQYGKTQSGDQLD